MIRLLNLGCGDTHHPEWVNLDADPSGEDVVACDLRKRLPFEAGSFDAVYASHVLEHLHRPQAKAMLSECFRVLRSGGVLRIAVPDLERIARLYLESIGPALGGDTGARGRHEWLMLEMYDQVVRTRSGGEMGEYLARPMEAPQRQFVAERIGEQADSATGRRPDFMRRLRKAIRVLRQAGAGAIVRLLLGREGSEALGEGMFRRGGETHLWMYDRYSLSQAVVAAGFSSFEVRAAGQSAIPGFARYGLEMRDGNERKPDSIYVEAVKP